LINTLEYDGIIIIYKDEKIGDRKYLRRTNTGKYILIHQLTLDMHNYECYKCISTNPILSNHPLSLAQAQAY
jgi:hypothetical protein